MERSKVILSLGLIVLAISCQHFLNILNISPEIDNTRSIELAGTLS